MQNQKQESIPYSEFSPIFTIIPAVALVALWAWLVLAAAHVLDTRILLLLMRVIAYCALPCGVASCILGFGPWHPWTRRWITREVQKKCSSSILTFAPSVLTFGVGLILIIDGFSASQFDGVLMGVLTSASSSVLCYRAWKKAPSTE